MREQRPHERKSRRDKLSLFDHITDQGFVTVVRVQLFTASGSMQMAKEVQCQQIRRVIRGSRASLYSLVQLLFCRHLPLRLIQ